MSIEQFDSKYVEFCRKTVEAAREAGLWDFLIKFSPEVTFGQVSETHSFEWTKSAVGQEKERSYLSKTVRTKVV